MNEEQINMRRRGFVARFFGVVAIPIVADAASGGETSKVAKNERTEAEWKQILTREQFSVLRGEGTERAFTSPLNAEKRMGIYQCAGCDLPVFSSDMKFDSGTGWPSFFTTLPGAFVTKVDNTLLSRRTEYHCVRCGGHHGHVFDDGPKPTGQRWCNNGAALKFIPA
jgi:peptide-methionine (R)-S-oxide reductase